MIALSTRFWIVLSLVIASLVLVGTAFAANNGKAGGTRPGWGYGDNNHVHTGPPGQMGSTVQPVQ